MLFLLLTQECGYLNQIPYDSAQEIRSWVMFPSSCLELSFSGMCQFALGVSFPGNLLFTAVIEDTGPY